MFVETELRLIRARLAAVVLAVESEDAALTPEAAADFARIEDYLRRIAECAAKMGVKMTAETPADA